jgi:serine/threonine-protein kinase
LPGGLRHQFLGWLFAGETVSHTLAEVLKGPIDLSLIPAGPMRDLAGRCLDRNLKTRLQHIGEARIAIENYREAPIAVKAFSANWLVTAAVAIAAAGAAWFLGSRGAAPAGERPLVRLNVDLGPDALLDAVTTGPGFAMSPDGTRIAYLVKNPAGESVLATRLMDQDKLTLLPGTEHAVTPFFSPDGQWIAFVSDNKLKKASVTGGGAVVLCDTKLFRGGAWLENGNIVAALGSREPLTLIPESGGTPTRLTEFRPGEWTHRWPTPVGRDGVMFISDARGANYEGANIEVIRLSTRERKVVHQGYFPHYLPSGHLAYFSKGILYAAPMDARNLALTGKPVPVIHDAAANPRNGSGLIHLGSGGTVIYRPALENGERVLGWIDETGKTEPLPLPPGRYQSFQLSPDSQRVAIALETGALAVYDLGNRTLSRLATERTRASRRPIWTPSGKHILYHTPQGIFAVRFDDGSAPQPLTNGPNDSPGGFSADGSRLYFSGDNGHAALTLDWTNLARPQPGAVQPLAVNDATPGAPIRVSPDGRWIAYLSDAGGNIETFVRPVAAGASGKWQISNGGSGTAEWSPTGRELLYTDTESRTVVVPYTVTGESFVPGTPRIWPQARGEFGTNGKRLLGTMRPAGTKEQITSGQVVMLLHFLDELGRKAGAPR